MRNEGLHSTWREGLLWNASQSAFMRNEGLHPSQNLPPRAKVSVRVHAERGATRPDRVRRSRGLSQSAFMRNEGLHNGGSRESLSLGLSPRSCGTRGYTKKSRGIWAGFVSVRVHAERGATPFYKALYGARVSVRVHAERGATLKRSIKTVFGRRLSPRSCGTRGYTVRGGGRPSGSSQSAFMRNEGATLPPLQAFVNK